MYINNFCGISPVGTIHPGFNFFNPSFESKNKQQLFCIEPDYSKWFTPLQLRRMSKPVRIGVASAIECLAGQQPDSIHVGTAYGVLYDTEIFLKNSILQEEKMLPPTSFIQSTHNTVAGAIALFIESHQHNMTFVHKAHSFEDALLDGGLLLNERPENEVLVGAVEEPTAKGYEILKQFDIYNSDVYGGEGATFFSISGTKRNNSICKLNGFELLKSNVKGVILNALNPFIKKYTNAIAADDLIVSGGLNNAKCKNIHAHLKEQLYPENEVVEFKHLSGEYPVAVSFGLAVATQLLKNNPTKRCWIINNYGNYWSFWLLEGMEFNENN